MKKRFYVAVGILMLAALGLLVWLAAGPREPVYQGKTLTRWLEKHVPTSSANPPFNSPGWKQADTALRQIGTNAIPTLLQMIRAKDPPPVILKFLDMAQKQGLARIRYRYASARNEEAEYAFQTLGASAVGAVPSLIEIYEENGTRSSQDCAARALGFIGHPAKAALPALLKNFTHTNGMVRFYAVSAVGDIGGEPELVVPAMSSVLKDPKNEVRWNAVVALRQYEARARVAVPELLEGLKDPALQEQVEITLWHVAPEAIAKVTVVEDATPMVANGATTEALCRIDGDRVSTIIPAGMTVPCARFTGWGSESDSQMRIVIALSRGANPTNMNQRFLGQFEVVGIPPPPATVHVQIAYVIVNQRILLCAYEDTRRTFLELRRVEQETQPPAGR